VFEVRIHGRGGQGVVTAAELLSVAAFRDGYEAQAFPSFGSERMGAPVVSFCRLAQTPIRLREPVTAPDAIVIIDATLLHHVDVFAGLRPDGYVLINSSRTTAQLGVAELADAGRAGRIATVPATDLARRYIGRSLPNVCLLGAFAALTGAVTLGSIEAAVRDRFAGAIAQSNMDAARAAFAAVREAQHA
jgi:pyruvate ferredoxin oxidoreductase gamma subunit